MEEYKVELTQVQITNLSVAVDVENKETAKMDVSYSASVFNPVDTSDPTVKVQVDAVFESQNKSDLAISCAADFIFNIDPIPENRAAVIRDYAIDIMQKELSSKVLTILKEMGHHIMFNP